MSFIRLTSLLFALLIYSSCNTSPTNIDLQNKKDVIDALSNTWEAEYMEMMGTRTKIPEGQISQMTLHKNGTYTGGIKDGVMKESGKWNYDPATHMLNMSRDNSMHASRIFKLTDKELIIIGYTTSDDVIVDSTALTLKKM